MQLECRLDIKFNFNLHIFVLVSGKFLSLGFIKNDIRSSIVQWFALYDSLLVWKPFLICFFFVFNSDIWYIDDDDQ